MTDRLDLSEPPAVRLCARCDGLLMPDRQWTCLACQFASERAMERAGGLVVTPAMIEAERGGDDNEK